MGLLIDAITGLACPTLGLPVDNICNPCNPPDLIDGVVKGSYGCINQIKYTKKAYLTMVENALGSSEWNPLTGSVPELRVVWEDALLGVSINENAGVEVCTRTSSCLPTFTASRYAYGEQGFTCGGAEFEIGGGFGRQLSLGTPILQDSNNWNLVDYVWVDYFESVNPGPYDLPISGRGNPSQIDNCVYVDEEHPCVCTFDNYVFCNLPPQRVIIPIDYWNESGIPSEEMVTCLCGDYSLYSASYMELEETGKFGSEPFVRLVCVPAPIEGMPCAGTLEFV